MLISVEGGGASLSGNTTKHPNVPWGKSMRHFRRGKFRSENFGTNPLEMGESLLRFLARCVETLHRQE